MKLDANVSKTADQLLTIREAAEAFKLPYFKVQRAVRMGLVPSYSLYNSRKYVKRSDIEKAMSRG